MRHFIVSVLFSAALVSCNSKEFTINGDAKGVKDGTEVILQKQDSTGIVRLDTVKVKDGKFKFEGEAGEPFMHYVAINGVQGSVVLILEPGDIDVTVDKDSVFKSKVGGTFNNDDLAKYIDKDVAIRKKQKTAMQAMQVRYQEAMMKNDTAAMKAIMEESQKFRREYEELARNHIKTNPKSYVSVILLEQFMKGGVDMEQTKADFKLLDESVRNTAEGKRIKKAIDKHDAQKASEKKIEVGQKAPEISANDVNGKKISLYASLGKKVTVLDFWASWCAPCRQESPNMVRLYNEFKDKGLNIVSVSLDRPDGAAAWKKAIADDQLTWTHMSNLKYWDDPILKTYPLKGIPATFVLDANGKILAKDLTGAQLHAKIAEILAAGA